MRPVSMTVIREQLATAPAGSASRRAATYCWAEWSPGPGGIPVAETEVWLMSENECFVRADVKDVFAILGDGWTYAAWVVGASQVREVDGGWPEPERRIHHSVGAWPFLIHDTTTAVEYEPLRRLRLRVRVWPAGEGEVEFEASEAPAGCRLVMRERVNSGPVSALPQAVSDLILSKRNAETLRRLTLLAEKSRQ